MYGDSCITENPDDQPAQAIEASSLSKLLLEWIPPRCIRTTPDGARPQRGRIHGPSHCPQWLRQRCNCNLKQHHSVLTSGVGLVSMCFVIFYSDAIRKTPSAHTDLRPT